MDPAVAIEQAALLKQKAMKEAISKGDSDIQQFYANRILLITGGTGFLGKHLIEKLLRSCDIKKIYLLLRTKKNKCAETRIHEVLQDPVFDSLRNQRLNFAKKLTAVVGDVNELGLGLGDEDRKKIATEVEIIVHAAATTRFDDTLKNATITNVRGTREILTLAKNCKKLRSFVYISTAYSLATKDNMKTDILEKFYPSPIEPEKLIDIAENFNDKALEDVCLRLRKQWPNTYTFTKIVTEELIRLNTDDLPICIVRPTIVIGSYSEPSPGWLDKSNVFGASGILLGLGLGIIHVVLADPDIKIDLIPVDMVTNTIIVTGWQTSDKWSLGGKDTMIYTVSNSRNPCLWGILNSYMKNDLRSIISPKAVWYCTAVETKYVQVAYLLTWLFHFIPAYFVDGILSIIGKEPILNKVYNKAWRITSVLSHFTTNEWIFTDTNTIQLYKSLTKTDQDIFAFDSKVINWKEMLLIWGVGLRKYILKDGLKDTNLSMKKQFWLKIVNYIVVAIYMFMWWYIFLCIYWILKFDF
ncbi:fatty acyl-CoA reductase wat-like [Achroia grisella]|uniref:fatty acyl-CoA reductase wat-like n=1 Tax=Achroia grisella TaxID=688607 RepID=UPI0027D209CB|nr:fatty acyl-CoA reductase wat-like [Achroia grisella]XP_059061567.1 fatty acyl-CoA reductase wat-like [Achroia grisella]XP_059061568.1 fatty acyl-CoA reductase wat-like [Achroia grisella]